MIKHYKRKKGSRVNPDSEIAEPGDLFVWPDGSLTRCESSSGRNMLAAGQLYSRKIKPPMSGLKACVINGEIFWTDIEFYFNLLNS